jgi:hypothetical protein
MGKASVATTPCQWSTLKRQMLSMPFQTNEHPMHLSVVTTDVRALHIACSRDKIITVNSALVMSEKDDDAYTREQVKAYTKAHIQFLQSTMFGHMFGFGPRLVYPKLDRVPDPIGGRKRTESHSSKPVMNGVLVNCISHLPTTAQYGEAPLEQFGKHNVDRISFAYEKYPETLTIRVKYISCSLLKAKRRNWIPCSEVYNDTHGAVEAGEMFPIDGVMHVVVQQEASDIVTVRINITNAIIQMPKQIAIAILNNSSNT